MEKEFVPFNLAVKLKELGFKRTCLAEYIDGVFYLSASLNNKKQVLTTASAPLWQQAFDWFRENHKLIGNVSLSRYKDKYSSETYGYHISNYNKAVFTYNHYETYEEARLSCLEKLIEIVENEKIQN